MKKPLFIILGGLPGVGKTTIARMLASHYGATYIRIDSIEQSIKNTLIHVSEVEDAGYVAGYLIAKDNLSLGNNVVADSVNSLNISRDAWRSCADNDNCHILEIELVCTNQSEHQKRVETRIADIMNQRVPSWKEVVQREYEYWEKPHIVIDTAAKGEKEVFEELIQAVFLHCKIQ